MSVLSEERCVFREAWVRPGVGRGPSSTLRAALALCILRQRTLLSKCRKAKGEGGPQRTEMGAAWGYSLSLPFLPSFSASQESTWQAAWGLLEPEKLCTIGLTNRKCALLGLVKQLWAVRLFSINIVGVSGQAPEVGVKRPLLREPRAQADAAGFALCPETSLFSREVREGSQCG